MSKLSCRCGYVMVSRTMGESFVYEVVAQKIIIETLNNWDKKTAILRVTIFLIVITNLGETFTSALPAEESSLKMNLDLINLASI